MNTPFSFRLAAGLLASVVIAGCVTPPGPQKPIEVAWTPEPVVLDGRLDEPVWQEATARALQPMQADHKQGIVLEQGGRFQLARDGEFLYAAIDLTDYDVTTGGTEDELHLYRMGDLAELFLFHQPTGCYWELYVAPNGLKTSMFYPSGGYRGRFDLAAAPTGLKVAANVQGTLNNWQDKDRGWTAEMALPLAHIEDLAGPFQPGADWRVLLGRYNFGRYLKKRQLSASVPLDGSFHATERYTPLGVQVYSVRPSGK